MSIGQSNRPTRIGARQPALFAVVAAAVFMTNLDLWIVNVALDRIGAGFSGSSLAGLSWVLNAYAVTLAALLVVAGRLGDRVGHRRVFLVGTAAFTVASLGCALAPNLLVLVVARVLQAGGAALQLPTSLALLLAGVATERRMGAARAWAAVGGLAAAAGPVLGGVLVQASWRWVFVINLPIGLISVVAGVRVLPRTPPRDEPLPDLAGGALLMVAVGALAAGIVQGPTWGWASARDVGLFATAVVVGGWFLRRCTRHPHPLVELPLLRVPRFGDASAALFVFSVAFSIMLLSNALWCEGVWGYSALRTGLAMVPGPALVLPVTLATSRIVSRVGAGRLAASGSLLFAAGMAWRFVASGVRPRYLVDLLPSMVLGGIGVGLALGTLMAVGATALPGGRAATGSAVMNMVRQVASSVGVAVLVTILGGRGDGLPAVRGYRSAWLVAALLSVVAAALSLRLSTRATSAAVSRGRESVAVAD